MSVSGIGAQSALAIQQLVNMRAQFDDLQRQLSTGVRSDTYAGIGVSRGLTVSLRTQLSALGGYENTITNVNTRVSLMTSALSRMSDIGNTVRSSAGLTSTASNTPGSMQQTAQASLDELLGLLNTQVGSSYLFSGTATDKSPVPSLDVLLNGDGTRAGLRGLIDERTKADLGADGLGRLAVGRPNATTVSLSEDVVSPFELKLASVSANLTNGTVSGPSGPPASLSVAFTDVPVEGDTVSLRFNLPDGSSETLTLTATADSPAGPNQFTIGANAATTADNLETALTASIGKLAGGSLAAASAVAASDQFFAGDLNSPPQRIVGPPFESATGFTAGTAADTVIWYTGEAGGGPARATASARVDEALTISYGVRANETGIRNLLRDVATLAAVQISASDPNANAKSAALNQRVATSLSGASGEQTVSNIVSEIATAAGSMNAAKERHQQTRATLEEYLQGIQNVTPEEVGARILALQTRMQATMQTTSMLFQTSLVNYLR